MQLLWMRMTLAARLLRAGAVSGPVPALALSHRIMSPSLVPVTACSRGRCPRRHGGTCTASKASPEQMTWVTAPWGLC